MGQYEYDHYHDGTGSPAWGPASGDYDDSDRPSAQELAEEDWDRERRQRYPRGYGPPYQGEDSPSDTGADGLYTDEEAPSLTELHNPGFIEEEVDDHPDPDIGHEDKGHPHPFGTPVYSPGGGYDDYDPHSSENLPEDLVAPGDDLHGNPVASHAERPEHRSGGILTQADQWPDRYAANKAPKDPYRDANPYQEFGHTAVDNLEPGEFLRNRDPNMGSTYPEVVGGDPEGAVTDARVMLPEETGLEYPVLARPAQGHGDKAYDILKSLG